MNNKELIEKIEALPAHNARNRPWIDKKLVLGLVRELNEPQKVTVPKYVANWICYLKGWNKGLHYGLVNASDEVLEWLCVNKLKRQEIFAHAWLHAYTVEEEKRYTIRFKNIRKETRYLKYDRVVENWYFGVEQCSKETKISHTRTELEEAGFDWVLDCPGIELEEVTE